MFALLLFQGAAGTALAMTNADARDELHRLDIDPTPLYPTSLPSRLQRADVSLTTSGGYSVTWDRGATVDQRVGYVELQRRRYGALRHDLRMVRTRGQTPRRRTIGRFHVWKLCGHICGYEWHYQHRTYSAAGIYYVNDGQRQVYRDMRVLVRRLRVLDGEG
jgi:hypothetical protein